MKLSSVSTMILIASAALLGACTVTVAPNGGDRPAAADPASSADFGRQLKEFAKNDPEGFADLVANAQSLARQKQQAASAERTRKFLTTHPDQVYRNPADPVLGNPDGDVTVVEWFDNECPFCKKLSPEIERLIERDPNIRVVMKEFPILGPVSDLSAKYALAAMKQGRYREFHMALMTSAVAEHQLTDAQLRDFAKTAGLDVERMVKDSQDPEIARQIAATHSLAASLGVSATPGLLVGTKIYSGPRTAEAILNEVAAARGKG